MASLKIRLRFNPGRTKAPMDKLGGFASQAEKFLRALAADLGVDVKKGKWLAHTFTNESVAFDGEYSEPVDDTVVTKGNEALLIMSGADPLAACNDGRVSSRTMGEFAKLGTLLDPDEHFFIGLYTADLEEVQEWRSVTHKRAAEIKQILEAPYTTMGSIQGIVHAWHSGAKPKFFQIRELATGALIRCEYESALHARVHVATRSPNTVAHVYGLIHWDRISDTATVVEVNDVEVVEPISEADFNSLFGSAPGFTGDISTGDYISWMRGDGDEE